MKLSHCCISALAILAAQLGTLSGCQNPTSDDLNDSEGDGGDSARDTNGVGLSHGHECPCEGGGWVAVTSQAQCAEACAPSDARNNPTDPLEIGVGGSLQQSRESRTFYECVCTEGWEIASTPAECGARCDARDASKESMKPTAIGGGAGSEGANGLGGMIQLLSNSDCLIEGEIEVVHLQMISGELPVCETLGLTQIENTCTIHQTTDRACTPQITCKHSDSEAGFFFDIGAELLVQPGGTTALGILTGEIFYQEIGFCKHEVMIAWH